MRPHILDPGLKKIGLLHLEPGNLAAINSQVYRPYIRMLYLQPGCKIKVDFGVYDTLEPVFFFIGPDQVLRIQELCMEPGYMIFYNRDCYCIQLHDDGLTGDSLLLSNLQKSPMTTIPIREVSSINFLFTQINDELSHEDRSREEMVRTYLKLLLMKLTRLWKVQHLSTTAGGHNNNLEFFRRFTRLVETCYKEKHGVAEYADLLAISPKTLTHKFRKMNLPQPNEVIKSRIVLEAKRLLVHSSKTVKQIAHELGYEDPAYFSRLFFIKTGESPLGFRAKYLNSKGA
jgi:AraC-like DNA-binding protein